MIRPETSSVPEQLAQLRHEAVKNGIKSFRSVQASAESTLHSKSESRRSGKVMPSRSKKRFCSAVGVVMRRRRISRLSVVGRMMSALRRVDKSERALAGESGTVVEPSDVERRN